MQKNLLLIFILISFSNYSLANSLPPLPTPEPGEIVEQPSAGSVSTWQKVKNFFGVSYKNNIEEASKEKPVDQSNLKIDNAASQDINTDNIPLSDNNRPVRDNDFSQEDKKLDISDDFFKEVEKHLQEEDKIISHTPEPENVVNHNQEDPTSKQDSSAITLLNDPSISHAENVGNQEAEKPTEAVKYPEALPTPEKVENMPPLLPREEKQEDPKSLAKELNPKLNEPNPIKDSKSYAISKFKEEIERRNAKRFDSLPKISDKDLAHNNDRLLEDIAKTDPKQLKFIADEAKVLIISNDDIVLGELTEEATLELMDFSSYVQLFWRDYDRRKRSEGRQVIDDFIENYDDNFNKVKWPLSTDDPYERLNDAFIAISKHDITKFIMILNNYPILGVKDKEQNSVLHQAAYIGNYSAVKLLIMKGIRLNDVNRQDETPLSIAEKYDNPYVAYLLKEAGAVSLPN